MHIVHIGMAEEGHIGMAEEDKVMMDVSKGVQVPFAMITDLFRDLRAKNVSIENGKRLLRCWRAIAKKYSHELLANRRSDDDIISLHLQPPEAAFKVISLICPTLDSVHPYIGMKENKLTETFIGVYSLFPGAKETIWLKNYRDSQYRPEEWKLAEDIDDGSFPSVLRTVLRHRCASTSELTIDDLWNNLTVLCTVL